jgi:hypothetical protein
MASRRWTVTLGAVLVLFLGLAGGASGQVIHIVTEGGPDADIVGPGGDYNASLIALAKDDGTVMGEWQDNLNFPGRRPVHFHARIVCLNVAGNEAWVVGRITSPAALRGRYAIQGLRDLGVSAGDAPDQITYIYWGLELGPDSCNAPPQFMEDAWADFSRGQIRVQ